MRKLLTLLILSSTLAFAQNSFYSSYGFGIESLPLPVRMIGMGNTGNAVEDSLSLNTLNPAFWNGFLTTSLQGQVESSFLNVPDVPFNNMLSRFMGFSFKLPISKKIGVAFGVMPTTRVHAENAFVDSTAFSDSFVKYKYSVEALGGISEFFIGGGYRINPQWRIGIKMQLYFGNYVNKGSTDINNNGTVDSYYKRRMDVNGSQIGLGFAWVDKSGKICLSGYVNQSIKFKYNTEYDYFYGPDSTVGFKSLNYPSSYRIGISKKLPKNLAFNADFRFTKVSPSLFSNFYQFEKTSSNNSYFIGVGLEKLPANNIRENKFLKRLFIRIGAYYKTEPFYYLQTVVEESGASFGIGVPFHKGFNRLDMALVASKRDGFLSEKIGSEKVISLHIGVTTGEIWFRKLKRH